MTIVILTEKKDQAEKIATSMGWKAGTGCFTGVFEGKPTKVVYARGHLICLQSPDEIIEGLSWDNPSQLLPIPRDINLKIIDDTDKAHPNAQPRSYVRNIESHLAGATELIISTDSDREGEAIGWNIVRFLEYKGPVRRAWLAAGLDKKSIIDAFNNLRPPHITKSWYRASEARNQCDWSTMFLVRAYTYFASYGVFGKFLGRGDNARSRVMSVGRVQTSALSMLVRREREIRAFRPQEHFKISIIGAAQTAKIEAKYSPEVTQALIDAQPEGVIWEPSRKIPEEGKPEPLETPLFVGAKEAMAFKGRLLEKNVARVVGYSERDRKENPPKTFSLTDAQSIIGTALSIPAGVVQIILEDLYEQGWTSYARTSKSELPDNFYEPDERNGLLKNLTNLSACSEQASTAMEIHDGKHPTIPAFKPSIFTSKQLEHHGIIPTHQRISDQILSSIKPKKTENGKTLHTAEQMQSAYTMVAKQFIQALFPPATYCVQDITIHCDVVDLLGNPFSNFTAQGERMTNAGWRHAFSQSAKEDSVLPSLNKDCVVNIADVQLKPATTTAPQRYNEKTFPRAMENVGREVKDPELRKRLRNSEGIGTPATRKTIIETLIVREYITVKSGNYFATPKGEELIDAVPNWLKTPETTALWEDFLVKLCSETDDNKAIDMRNLFIKKQVDSMEALISELMTRYQGKLGEKVKNTNIPTRVTDKMKSAIEGIERSKGIRAPAGAKSNPYVATMFLNQHMQDRGDTSTPSQNQVDFAKRIIENIPDGYVVPENVLTDRKACSAFIDAAKEYAPPSQAQKNLVQDLIRKLPEGDKPDPDEFNTSSKCKAFIDSILKKTTDGSPRNANKAKSTGHRKYSPGKSKAKTAKPDQL